MKYSYYGFDNSKNINIKTKYKNISNPNDFYDIVSKIWCKNTCAKRMQDNWSKDNISLGQCSITSILFQEVFGGQIYGILLDDGNYHCFNILNGYIFDLTSDQFKDEKLDYSKCIKQNKEDHLIKKEKKERYNYLKEQFEILIK